MVFFDLSFAVITRNTKFLVFIQFNDLKVYIQQYLSHTMKRDGQMWLSSLPRSPFRFIFIANVLCPFFALFQYVCVCVCVHIIVVSIKFLRFYGTFFIIFIPSAAGYIFPSCVCSISFSEPELNECISLSISLLMFNVSFCEFNF